MMQAFAKGEWSLPYQIFFQIKIYVFYMKAEIVQLTFDTLINDFRFKA